jgi:aminopeptidase N
MARVAKWLGTILAVLLMTGCAEKSPPAPQPGVALELARERAARLSDIRYRLRFDIPRRQDQAIAATAVITFDLADNTGTLPLDFRQDATSVHSLRVNGEESAPELVNEHLLLPARLLKRGRNEIEIAFVAGDTSLNRNPDFLYTLLVPDRARTVFPVFEQPDLKARFELTLVIPAGWRALANAPLAGQQALPDGREEYRFAPSDPISTYQFAFVAGDFQVVSRSVDGRAMTLYHRETDKARVARNLDAIFALHGQALAWLEDYTGIPYPFQKFDFVLLPGFPYGGMEHVGAIQYRASRLLLDENPPLTELLGRAHLIAHETAHMWFGNLVTMKWFDDVWTKEVFANFMADKIVNPAFPGVDHDLNFLVGHYPAAYAVDRSEGANPIRQALPNLNQAGQLYGSIIYHKAPIMMRQLELIVGSDGLRAGLAQYLRRFSYGNATWPELIAILDTHTDRDLAAWSEVWVNTPGRPQFLPAPPDDEHPGVFGLLQLDTAGQGRLWPQQFQLLTVYGDAARSETLVTDTGLTSIPRPVTDDVAVATLFNADGHGYGRFPGGLDALAVWDRLTPVQRGAALINAEDNLLAGEPLDVDAWFARLLAIVQEERDPLLLRLALGQLQYAYFSLLDDTRRELQAPVVEDALWTAMLAQPDSSHTRLVYRYFAEIASSPARVQQLYDIWSGALKVENLTLGEEDQTRLAEILAIRLPQRSAAIIARQLADTVNPDRRRRLEFIAPSLSAEPAVRDAFFASLAEEKNRQTERWVNDALSNLHHPSRLAQAQQYVLPSLELLEEIQRTGDIFFPSSWLAATLGYHHSAATAKVVRDFLAARPDYNPQLRMKILQAADPLFRAVAIRAAQGAQAGDIDSGG